MKFVISMFMVSTVWAAPINLYDEGNSTHARIYKEVLKKDYKIPDELIEVDRINNCEHLKAVGKLDLCLKNNGDLKVVSVDERFVKESLRIFRTP
jgi:hypothetical protein